MRVSFDLEFNPTATSQQKGVNFKTGQHYEKQKVRVLRQIYRLKITSALRRSGSRPPRFHGPVRLDVIFIFSIKERKRWGTPKDTKPDCDNTVKLLQDALGDIGFFEKGDQQVTDLRVRKIYGERPQVIIDIDEVKE